MIPLRPRLPKVLVTAFLSVCVLLALFDIAAARGRATRLVSSRARIVKAARVVHGRGHQRAAEEEFAQPQAANYNLVPDKVEVVEFGSQRASELTRLPAPANPGFAPGELLEPARRRGISIDTTRVAQIQQALASRGFYQGELSGAYDDQTIGAMQRFQLSQKIATTGYPTAHALKRLGLGSW